MGILDNLYRHDIFARNDKIRHIELTPHEGAVDTSHRFAIHKHVRFPVNTVEVQEQAILLETFGHLELVAIPEIGIKERLGYLQLVVRIVRIGDCPDILVTAQDCSRHSGHDPVLRLVTRSRDFLARSRHFRRTL